MAYPAHPAGPTRRQALLVSLLGAPALKASRARASDSPYVVLAGDLPPFAIDNNPSRPGFIVELVGEAFRRLGLPFAPVFEPWSRAQRDAERMDNALLIGLTRSNERESRYLWVAELARLEYAFQTRRGHQPVVDFADAIAEGAIAVRPETVFERSMATRGAFNLVPVPSEEAGARMLAAGRVDAWFTYSLRARSIWKDLGYPPKELVIGEPVDTGSIYLAANRAFPADVANRIGAMISTFHVDGTEARIYERYFGPPR